MFENLAIKCFFKISNCNIRKIFTYLLNSRSITPIKNTCRKSGNIFTIFSINAVKNCGFTLFF